MRSDVLPGTQEGSHPNAPLKGDIYHRPIEHHGGAKYLRTIHSAIDPNAWVQVDVYCIIEAYDIRCPALQHALKKIVACGGRGKGSKLDDIKGVLDAMWRALELQEQREENSDGDAPTVNKS